MKHPPTHAPLAEGIVVHEPMALGGVRHHSIRGFAVGFDETGSLVQKIDVDDLSAKQLEQLKLVLSVVLERGGAQLH